MCRARCSRVGMTLDTRESGSDLTKCSAPLGAGGMGEVYRARDTRLDREVAVKVLPATFASDPALRQRLQTEARAISQLSHPHICTLFDVGEEAGTAFLVMELIDGETLAGRLRPPGRTCALPLDEALQHRRPDRAGRWPPPTAAGIVHRDLKPGNVMLARGRSPRLRTGAREAAGLRAREGHVQPGSGRPTSRTLPTTPPVPLTAAGHPPGHLSVHGPRADRRATRRTSAPTSSPWAASFTRCSPARAPSKARATPASSRPSSSASPTPIATRQPGVPSARSSGIVDRCLAKDPDERWQSACRSGHGVEPGGRRRRSRLACCSRQQRTLPAPARRRAAVAVALAVLAVGGRRPGPGGSSLAPPQRLRGDLVRDRAAAGPDAGPPPPSPPRHNWRFRPTGGASRLSPLRGVARPRSGSVSLDSRAGAAARGHRRCRVSRSGPPDGRFHRLLRGRQAEENRHRRRRCAGPRRDARLHGAAAGIVTDVILFTPAPNRGIWRIPASGGRPAAGDRAVRSRMAATNHVWPQFLARWPTLHLLPAER